MKQKFIKLGLLVVMLLNILPALAFEVDGIHYNVVSTKDLTCEVTNPIGVKNGYKGDVVIPSEVTYDNQTFKITAIGGYAFAYCNALSSVTIPESVTIIEESAFRDCTSLTSVSALNVIKLGSGSGASLDGMVFYGCTSLTNVELPSAEIIGENTFYGCSSLVSIELPYAQTIYHNSFEGCEALRYVSMPYAQSIGKETFLGCNSLETVDLPHVREIGIRAFKDCRSLYFIDFPEATSIRSEAFGGCVSLETVDLPEATSIGREAFLNCQSLENISFTKIEGFDTRAFDGCFSIRSIKLENKPVYISEDFFSNRVYVNAILYVPEKYLESYKKSIGWRNFFNIYSLETSGVDDIELDSVEKSVVERYDVKGRVIKEDYRGISIVRFSDGSVKKVIL